MSFPLSRLQEGGVGCDAEWQSLLACPSFSELPDEDTCASLATVVGLTVERQHPLWKAPDAQVRGPALVPGVALYWSCLAFLAHFSLHHHTCIQLGHVQ